MIFPKVRDPRFVTIRRGGTLTDEDHCLLALWAAAWEELVLVLFESARPGDPPPRQAIEHARAWVRGEVRMMEARAAGGHAIGAATDLRGQRGMPRTLPARPGRRARAAHELGAAAYPIKAARAAAPERESETVGRLECQWQRNQLPKARSVLAGGSAPGPAATTAAWRRRAVAAAADYLTVSRSSGDRLTA
ncbi:putative immunity protein [Streptomyces sp. NPDC054787]